MQTAIATAASWRALAGSTLQGTTGPGHDAICTPGIGGPRAHKAWSTAAPRRSGCGGGVVTPSPVRDPSPRYAWRGCHVLPPSASPSQHAARPSRARHPARPWWQLSAEAVASSLALLPRRALQATGVSYGGSRGPRAGTVLTPGAGFHTKQALSVDAIQELLPGGRGRPAALARLKERDNGAHTAVVIVGLWDVQLHQDAAHVFFDGSFGDPKLPGDARI